MKNIKYIVISFATILFAGCNDFLELTPETNEGTTLNFYKNNKDIEYALTAAYADLQNAQIYRTNLPILIDIRSDDMAVFSNIGLNSGREYSIKIFTAASDLTIFLDAWSKLYEMIYRCNNVIKYADVVNNATLRVQYEAEARFLRALCYFNIVRLWGDAPLILSPLTPSEVANCIRNSTSEVYAAIEADLKFAANPDNLPKSFSGNNQGRATSLAAKGLLGKVYLQQKKWTEAKTILGELINTDNAGTHQLLPDIADVFSTAPAHGLDDDQFWAYTGWKPQLMNREIMFCVLFNKDIAGEGRGLVVHYDRLTDFNEEFVITSPKCIYDAGDRRSDLLRLMKIAGSSANIIVKYADVVSSLSQYGFCTPILRWSDILLMYAEAANEAGFDNSAASPALKALNDVRTRSFPSGAYTTVDLASQDAFRRAVWLERRLEFPIEMQRLFDLQRYESVVSGEAIKAMKAIGLDITKDQLLYPIPYMEVSLRNDSAVFPQNPGY
ncbi:MAG: RagB/SusD family nutrient uptake outer membrane protein [Tannerella sp.]|nr:RagB/SusD family nutrient uptake outer membrane protein [Tannerella sp.]